MRAGWMVLVHIASAMNWTCSVTSLLMDATLPYIGALILKSGRKTVTVASAAITLLCRRAEMTHRRRSLLRVLLMIATNLRS